MSKIDQCILNPIARVFFGDTLAWSDLNYSTQVLCLQGLLTSTLCIAVFIKLLFC